MSRFDTEFLERYAQIEQQRGRTVRHADPEGDLDDWSSFVDYCVAGYDDNLAFYDFKLILRAFLEVLLQDQVLRVTPSFDVFAAAVEATDERLKRILTVALPRAAEDLPWWHRAIPYYGGEEFVEDVKKRLGIDLELVAAES